MKARSARQSVTACLHGIRSFDRGLQRPGDQNRDLLAGLPQLRHKATGHMPTHAALPHRDLAIARLKQRNEAKDHRERQPQYRRCLTEEIDQLVRRHDDVEGHEPDHDRRQHRRSRQPVAKSFQRNPQPIDKKKCCFPIMRKQGIDHCHDQKQRDRKQQIGLNAGHTLEQHRIRP